MRQPDPRIAAQIHAALGDSQTVLNIGAGTGAYELLNRVVTAVEPSSEMIAQRTDSLATVVQSSAESLPFEENSFDAVMAILTVHHWTDKAKGMAEMLRVSRGPIVILTYDPSFRDFWLFDYFPNLVALDDRRMPPLNAYTQWLGSVTESPVLIPHDCTDGFLAAYWRRPKAYLDSNVRSAMSSFWKIGDYSQELARLSHDLDNGTWMEHYGELYALDARDFGYRLVVAG